MLLAILVARVVGGIFNKSIYARAIRAKNIPLLKNRPPRKSRDVKVRSMMTKNVKTCRTIIPMREVQ